MPFHFSLQPVLHLRQSLERQQELRLRAAHQRVARVRHLIEAAEQRHGELRAEQLNSLSSGTTAAELHFGLQCEAELDLHRKELDRQLAILQQACEKQRELLQQARRGREILESLRDQTLRLYEKQARRSEQRNLDDLFLLRREHLRRG